jgi:HYR domain
MLVALTILVGTTVSAAAAARPQAKAGTVNLNTALHLVSVFVPCPSGVSATGCAERTARGPFPGLGPVTATYTFMSDVGPPCPAGFGRARSYPARFAVPSKGEIHFDLAAGEACVNEETDFAVRAQTQAFTVTGGTGIYAGASGSGTVTRSLTSTTTGAAGSETWSGTLTVPGFDFDLTPPTLRGAANKTVRAKQGAKAKKRAKATRVAFRVTAQDDRDGTVPVRCTPRSGSRFKLGRTRVTCSATDSSANTATATFVVTVKPRR